MESKGNSAIHIHVFILSQTPLLSMLPRNTEQTSLNGSTNLEDSVLVQEFRKKSNFWNDFCLIVTMTLHSLSSNSN